MLINKLKQKEYYLSKLSLFLRNSYGIEQQFEIFWKLLVDFDTSIDDVFTALSMDANELDNMTDMLDKIAELVGTKRQLDVTYIVSSVREYHTLTLNNHELARLIQTRILQNNYIGTFYEFVSNYKRIGFEVLIFDTNTSSKVTIVLNDNNALTDNDKHLFLSGNYTIRSMGIVYEHAIQNLTMLAVWDNVTSVYDTAQWGE